MSALFAQQKNLFFPSKKTKTERNIMSYSKALISVAFAFLLLAMVVLADEYSHTVR